MWTVQWHRWLSRPNSLPVFDANELLSWLCRPVVRLKYVGADGTSPFLKLPLWGGKNNIKQNQTMLTSPLFLGSELSSLGLAVSFNEVQGMEVRSTSWGYRCGSNRKMDFFLVSLVPSTNSIHNNVDTTTINQPFGNGLYNLSTGMVTGGRFIRVLPTLYIY